MHVAPGSRAEKRGNRHVSAARLASARVALRELDHFDYRITRLTAGEIGYCEAAIIIGPVRQGFTAKQVDRDCNVRPRFDDWVERYGSEGNSVNQALLTAHPGGIKTWDRERCHKRFPQR